MSGRGPRDAYKRNEGYEDLAAAIVAQAVWDYYALLSGFLQPTGKLNPAVLEKFFRSPEYQLFTDSDPEALMEYARKQAKQTVMKFDVRKEKGSNRYYVFSLEEQKPVAYYKKKQEALREASKMQGVDYKVYMKIRRRDGADD